MPNLKGGTGSVFRNGDAALGHLGHAIREGFDRQLGGLPPLGVPTHPHRGGLLEFEAAEHVAIHPGPVAHDPQVARGRGVPGTRVEWTREPRPQLLRLRQPTLLPLRQHLRRRQPRRPQPPERT